MSNGLCVTELKSSEETMSGRGESAQLDDTIRDLADLPVGCHAWRTGDRRAFLERSFQLS
jgi:hypothetical protein